MKGSIGESFVSICRLWYTRGQEVLFENSCQKIKTSKSLNDFFPRINSKKKKIQYNNRAWSNIR